MGLMKKYSQFLKELPSKTVVFAFGRFNPPTTGHELLVKAVKKLAQQRGADHAIYASRTQDKKKNPLSVDKKVHYLNLMFPGTHFVPANDQERTFIEAAKNLNKKYKNLIMIAGSDRIQSYNDLLHRYNGKEFHFDTIQVVSAGERDPDADDASGMSGTKMRQLAAKGDYSQFKRGLPSSVRDLDGKRLMNDVREGMGLEPIKEQVKFTVDSLREKYFKGEIYQVGQFVECEGKRYEILDRGSNYLVLSDEGNTVRKWITDVVLSENQVKEDVQVGYAPKEITYKGYTTKNFHNSEDAAKAFQETISRESGKDPVAILNALKATDTYMGINDRHIAGEELTPEEINDWKLNWENARKSLERVGEFAHHEDYWHMHQHELEGLLTNYAESGKGDMNEELTDKTIRPTDKVKVARIIATMLGIDKVENTSNPELLVNTALRRLKSKNLNPEALGIVRKILDLAGEVGIEYDTNLIPQKLKEDNAVVKLDAKKKDNISQDILTRDDKKKIGSTLVHPGEDDTVRKMKIKQMTEEAEEEGEEDEHEHEDGEICDECECNPCTCSEEQDELANLSDEELEKIADGVTEDEIMDEYEDGELAVIDAETGEECEEEPMSEQLMEVLSRVERMRARVRFAKTKAKRERREQIALKMRSSNKVINRRSRRLAVKLMKKRLLRGRNANAISVGEKERIERIVQKRKAVINRLAMKLAPRVRKTEQARLSHSKYTKGNNNVSF